MDEKEEFCPICVTSLPTAFSTPDHPSEDKHKRKRRHHILKWCVLIFILFLFIFIAI